MELIKKIKSKEEVIKKGLGGYKLEWSINEESQSQQVSLKYKNILDSEVAKNEKWPPKLDKNMEMEDYIEFHIKFFKEFVPIFEKTLKEHINKILQK